MDAAFWLKRWARNEIAFHEGAANALLVRHFDVLALPPGARVFVPLCGKTGDIGWLLGRGIRVAGAELSRTAVEALFDGLGVVPEVTRAGPLEHFAAPGLDIYAGDIFDLEAGTLGRVDAVHDRAALVALPDDLRTRYAAHLVELTGRAPQILVCFEYDQSAMTGPPFSVGEDEVARLYGSSHRARPLETVAVPGGLKGRHPATETIWHLRPI